MSLSEEENNAEAISELIKKKEPYITKVPGFGQRHVQVLLLFSLMVVGVSMRVQLNIAIVAMTEKSTSPNPDVPVFDWENNSIILSSFLWGYWILQVLTGDLASKYGGKYFLLGAMLSNSLLCCLIPPLTVKYGSNGLIVCRILQGMSQGMFTPGLSDILSKWIPLSERARMGNMIISGAPFGIIITNPVVGYISTSWYGWPLSFYLYGCIGFLWCIVFYVFGASVPAMHKYLSIEERQFIESNLSTQVLKIKTPWRRILTNIPFWAIFATQLAATWTDIMLNTELPIYINKVMKFDVQDNSLLNSAPPLVTFVMAQVYGYLADYVINRNILCPLWSRKLFTAIGSIIPSAALFTLGLLPSHAITLSIVMILTSSATSSALGAGSGVNHIDLFPNFAAILVGIIDSTCCIVSISGPVAVQFIVTDETNKSQWRTIFIMSSILYLTSIVIYLTLASADNQEDQSSQDNNFESSQDNNFGSSQDNNFGWKEEVSQKDNRHLLYQTTPANYEVVMKAPFLTNNSSDVYPSSTKTEFRYAEEEIKDNNNNDSITATDNDAKLSENVPSNGFFAFLQMLQQNLLKSVSHKNKIEVLKNLRDMLLKNLYVRILNLWKPKSRVEREARGYKDEHEMDFPSNEGALMTIGFLTFAVFLIKLVIKLVQAIKYKYMYYATTTTTTAATVVILKRKRREELNEKTARIMSYIDKYPY